MIRVIIDFESAYGKHPDTQENITLSKMTTEEYVRHPHFKVHGLGVQIDQDEPFYVYGGDLIHFLRSHPWDRTFVIAHHAHFDGAILSWRAGIRPVFWGCTLSMARALFPHESGSLANLARLLNLGEKGHELASFQGNWTLTDEEQQVMGSYCKNDIALTAAAFDAMKRQFPVSEMRLIDMNIRLFTEPCLEVDRPVLIEEYKRERRSKRALLKACNTDQTILASGDKFAALLLSLGVAPPKKLSPSKIKDGRVDPDKVGEPPLGLLPSFKAWKGMTIEEKAQLAVEKDHYPWAYAFGKSDEEFKLFLEHPDPQVQAVVEARLGVKSTIKETRSKRFFKIGKRGKFPVYHNYYGAKTGRDCLTGDTRIYVLRCCKIISVLLPELRPDDLVWDGKEFVAHGGLAYRGKQEVITYDGITGTLAHQVFCEEAPTAIALSAAAARGYKIKVAEPPPGYAGVADDVPDGGPVEPAK